MSSMLLVGILEGVGAGFLTILPGVGIVLDLEIEADAFLDVPRY